MSFKDSLKTRVRLEGKEAAATLGLSQSAQTGQKEER